MANKKLRFVALIAVALVLVCMLVACTTTTTKANYNVIIHLGDGQSDITWDRQADFPTLSREHYLEEGLYLDAEFKTATTREDLKAMWLTGDIDVYVNWTKIIYKITVHPANGEQDVIWEPAPGNKIPAFTKVGYIMDGFYFDENCTQSADSVFAEELLENKEVWVKWNECDHKAVTEWTEDKKASCTEAGHKIATCPTCAKELEDTITALGHNSDGVVTHKDANCTEDGVVGGTYCTRCGLGRVDAETVIPALGHKYGETTIAWNDDYTAFIATRTCSNCTDGVDGHTQTATSTWHGIYVTTTQPTCTEAGVADYIVVFDVDWIKGDQWISAIQPAEGHNYTKVNHDDTHHWKECSVCGDVDESSKGTHTYNQTVAIDEYLATSATCQAKATYYKSCECGAHGTETFESGDALGHDYGETSYSWNDDYTVCTATHACKRVGFTDEVEGHTETATAIQIDSNVTQVQTCENPELTTYTAMFGVAWAETQTKADIHTKDALGHNTSQICKDENNHWYACVNDGCTYTTQEVAHAWDEGKQTKEPTETEQGEKTFTCTLCWQTKIEYTGFASHKHEFDTTKWSHDTEYHWHPTTCGHTVKDNTSGYEKHVYGDVTYTWSSDNTKCTAVHSCKCGYSESEEATITTSVTEATCTTAEYTTYTATFKNTAFAEQTKANNKTGEANGHHYGAVTYALDDYYTITNNEYTFIATRTCSNCAEGVEGHTQTATSVDWAFYNVITEPTCTEKGEANYYVTFNVDWIDGKQIVSGWMSKSGHKYTVTKHDDTHHWKECSVCGDVDESSKGTHTYDQNVVHEDYLATPATCIATAKYYKTCECGAMGTETFDDSHYAKHTFSEDAWQNEVPATCTSTGIVAHKDCSVCGKHCDNEGNVIADDNYTIAKDEDAHKYGEWTSNGDGTHSRVCEYNAEHKETGNCSGGTATCTEKAECTVCHEEYGVLGSHNYGEWIKKVDPSCLEEGTLGHYHCSVCEKNFDAEYAELESLTIAKASHTTQHTAKVDATCSEDGNIEYWYCTGCEAYFSDEACTTAITVNDTEDGRVIPATGNHTYTFVNEKPATASEAGTKAHYHCNGCGKDFDLNKAEVSADDLVIEIGKKATYTSTIVIEDYAKANKWVATSGNSGKQYDELSNDFFSIKMDADDSNSGKYYIKSGVHQWRLYKTGNAQFAISTTYKTIVSVTIVFTGESTPKLKLNDNELTSGELKAVNAGNATIVASNGKVFITQIKVEFSFKSAEEIAQEELAKAQEAANELKLDEMKTAYSATGTYDSLPTTDKNGAIVTWSVDNNDYCSITEDGKLSIDKIENQTITLSVAVKVGTQTVNKTVDIKISADTLQYKLTIPDDKTYIVIEVKDAEGATVSGGTMVDEGTTLTITVTNNDSENYAITKVLAGTIELTKNEDGSYTHAMTGDTTISVEVKEILNSPQKIVDALYALGSGESLEGTYELTGKITSIDTVYNSGYGNITVTIANIEGVSDATKTVKCYRLKGDNAEILMVNDIITVSGTLINYNNTREFAEACTIKVYTKGTSKITVTAENATVTFDDGVKADTAIENGTTVKFAVSANTGYTLVSVKVGSNTIAPTDGKYSITLNTGDVTITVTTKEEGAAEPTVVATFEFGDANTSKTHTDGSVLAKNDASWEVDKYTLTFSALSSVYNGAYDNKGNSALKLGTKNAVGSFTFTAPDNVTKVVIYVAKYKTSNTIVNINGTENVISTSSNDGSYTAIAIDVSTTKTVTFATVKNQSRCMVDKIEFYA